MGFTYEQLKTFPLRLDELITNVVDSTEMQTVLGNSNEIQNGQKEKSTQLALLKYCIDKSILAKEGRLHAIVGRDKELRMMAEIPGRCSKPKDYQRRISTGSFIDLEYKEDSFQWNIKNATVDNIIV